MQCNGRRREKGLGGGGGGVMLTTYGMVLHNAELLMRPWGKGGAGAAARWGECTRIVPDSQGGWWLGGQGALACFIRLLLHHHPPPDRP